MAEIVILDAGPLVAMADRRDAAHEWTVSQLRRLREPLRCCGAVLGRSVVCSSPFSPALRRIRAEIERGNIIPEPESVTVWRRCFALIEQYANVPMSFADAYLIAMAEALPGSQIFTLDRDFEIYRMENGQSPALIAPFGTD